ncbi:MAG: hypothetical protein JWR16_1087 [Nevskia sp.]|nr:hypothetical protein [Nevskia sp.]
MISFPTVCILVMAFTGMGALLPWWEYSSAWGYWPSGGLLVAVLGVLAWPVCAAVKQAGQRPISDEPAAASSKQFPIELKQFRF